VHWGDGDAPSMIMDGAASELTDEELQAVASYIQGLYRASE
jgi:cytochrome c553